MKEKMGRLKGFWFLVSIAMVATGWLGVNRLNNGLVIRDLSRDGVPLRFLVPEKAVEVPAVIVAHGISVSREIMLGFGYALAREGYGAILLDFAGHGASREEFEGGDQLAASILTAYRALARQPEVDGDRIALLGHSMGSGAVMSAGIAHPELFRAVIAISPTGAQVNDTLPPNLLLMAGALEGPFVENGRELLVEAGGPDDDFAAGRARAFIEIPGVEHATILFSPRATREAIGWLNRTFARSGRADTSDLRMLWYALHLAGWLGLALAIRSSEGSGTKIRARFHRSWRPWPALLLAPVLATSFLGLSSGLVDLSRSLGQLFGGALAIWFLIAGLVWLFSGFRPVIPAPRALLAGIIIFAVLWLSVGLMAQFTWLRWFLVPRRLALWPILAAACLPWKVAAGYAQGGATAPIKAAWWLAQALMITGGLVAAAFLVPGLFVLILMAPFLPLVLAIETIVGSAFDEPWAHGLGSALFFGWLLAALFPLV